ncbi:MAG: flagellar biosynthetic protein FliR [Rhodospirillales bacterium]|nr:flagellar biosynthetic protein FliR [Rhodospirillales bacterium]MCB9973671.1 flagellar biosynthetic protein FliR [Rhodospirillales bacterium]MCB9980632.1 flagellar biosynthetic protein FliR [Rhodospirillales bacterium]
MLENLLVLNVTAFMLTFARLGAAAMIMPGVGDSFVSSNVRLLFALAFSFVMTPIVAGLLPTPLPTGVALYVLIGAEVIIGLFIGTVTRIFMAALDTAGMVVSIQSGLANAQVFNPSFATQGSVVGAFFSVTGVVLLLSSNLYLVLLYGLYDSYHMFPVGGLPPAGDMSELIARAVSASFMIGVQIAAPFMIVAFILYVGMGVLARLMPQIQIFILSLPVQILLSFLTMSLILSAGFMFWLRRFEEGLSFFFTSGG